ncbi:MAG TPA: hypothetical protein EYQ84_08465, partial [Nitrospinaceae bacterium]|nr:hypothetical protein [Nitrospinaceae bacterium]
MAPIIMLSPPIARIAVVMDQLILVALATSPKPTRALLQITERGGPHGTGVIASWVVCLCHPCSGV